MVSITKLLSVSGVCATVIADSAEFALYSLSFSGKFPMDKYSPLQYDDDGVIGLYRDCDSCYNFTGRISDNGYYELEESEEGDVKDSKYFTIDEDTGKVSLNDSANTAPFEISTHIFYYNSSKDYTLVEVEENKTYHLYFLDAYNGEGKNYSSTLNTVFPNGTRYLSWKPDDAETTQSISKIGHIPQSTGGGVAATSRSSSQSSSTSPSEPSSSSTASSGASKEVFGFASLFCLVLGWVYAYTY